MRHTPSLDASLAHAVALAGCTWWSPATGSAGAPSGTAPGLAGSSPVPGVLGGGTQPAQGPTTERKLYAIWVMKGRALVDGTTPLANAELRAFDVQTGLPLSFAAWEMAGNRPLPGVPRTDAEGRWTLAFTPIAGNRVLRLVARTKDHTVVTLFTSTGQALPGQAEGGAGKYSLKATGKNPLFQNNLWWFGTPYPIPPANSERWVIEPLATLPGFLGPHGPATWGWFNSPNYETCVLGITTVLGPCATLTGTLSYNRNGCAYRVLATDCSGTPLKDDAPPSEAPSSDPAASTPAAGPEASSQPSSIPTADPGASDPAKVTTLADNPVDQEKAAELMAEVPLDPNTTLDTVALEAGKVKFNLKLTAFTKAVEQTRGTERTALNDALDAIKKAIENTSNGSTFQAFASAFFAENGTVSDAKGFTDALSKGSSAFKSSFQAILTYLDVTFESDPVAPPAATGTPSPNPASSLPTAPSDLFEDSGTGGGRRRAESPTPLPFPSPSPSPVSTGLFTLVTGNSGDTGLAARYDGALLNAGSPAVYDVMVDAVASVFVSYLGGWGPVSLGSIVHGGSAPVPNRLSRGWNTGVEFGAIDGATELSGNPGIWQAEEYGANVGGSEDGVFATTGAARAVRYSPLARYGDRVFYLDDTGIKSLPATAPLDSSTSVSNANYYVVSVGTDFAVGKESATDEFYTAEVPAASDVVRIRRVLAGAFVTTVGEFPNGGTGQAAHLAYDGPHDKLYLSQTTGSDVAGYATRIWALDLAQSPIASSVIAGGAAPATFVGSSDDAFTPTAGRIGKVWGMAISNDGTKLYLTENSEPVLGNVYGRVRQLDLP